ncbi:alpha/beta hydrolase [Dyella amyloliquefaciens]|uniref:alpha/beta hydrolase n=1 Tax=Dyella amyloliquefaciens TaxID=1770545 RepID=UPI00102EC8D4|nr:alpha/beta fold hydrolase [Dyella amyloliquefaciens]
MWHRWSLAVCAGLFGWASMAHAASNSCEARSAEILDALRKGDFASATTHFDARVKAAVDAQKLGEIWQHMLPAQFGAFDHADAPKADLQGGAMVETPLHFAHGNLLMRVACHAEGEVSGLRFLPVPASPATLGQGERQLEVPSPLGPLPGIFTMPSGSGSFPVVVLVAGSGPHDGDETIGPNKPFRDIAQGLAAAGIASLRYDKRTFTYAAQMAARNDVTIDDEVTDDALAAIKLAGVQPGVDPHRVFVLGHSLGAYIAPRIGQRDAALAGLILLAAPARSLLDVQAQQVREIGKRQGLSEAQIANRLHLIEAEREWLAGRGASKSATGSFGGVPQSYELSLRDYDVVATAKAVGMPMLILQGGSDFQVSPEQDFARWQTALAGRPRVAFRRYDDLSHLFMPAGSSATPADYQVPGKVDPRVIRDISNWVKEQPAGG